MTRHAPALALLLLAAAAAAAVAQTPRAKNPHGDMDLDCRLCHTEQNWDVQADSLAFDHDTTGFPLEGRHAGVPCRDCHEEPVFAHVGVRCQDCHQDPHRDRLGPDCEACHQPTGWVDRSEERRAHDATAFPLVGAHARVDCDACHEGAVTGEYVGTPTDCVACHLDTYQGTTDPDHTAAGFPTDCRECHDEFASTWGRGDFIHSPRFPLTGAHARTACVSCHEDGFAGTPTECYACHQAEYDATSDPGHLAAGFPTTCAACHSTNAWEPATFDHATTGFALTGAHRTIDCRACHAAGYAGTPTDCYACHQQDYDATSDPNHAASSFPTTCATCHTTTAWEPANFDHDATAFPLTGAHRALDCLSCHASGYTGTPTACAACHQDDYDRTTDPAHAAAGFPTTCQNCHSTNAWEPASFDHDAWFPISSGRHSGLSCSECHVTPNVYSSFECILCHTHNQADTDRQHAAENVRNYVYESNACYECHPRGRAE